MGLYDIIYPQMQDKDYVLCGTNALHMSGLYNGGFDIAEVYTELPLLDQMIVHSRIRYYYVEHVSLEYLHPHPDFPHILIPSPERALIDCIRYDMRFVDEGAFCESMDSYTASRQMFNPDLLREVARHYAVPWETVEYWMSESYGAKR